MNPKCPILPIILVDLQVFFTEDEYRVLESGGPLMVCLRLNYETDQDFIADINVRENNPIDAIGVSVQFNE